MCSKTFVFLLSISIYICSTSAEFINLNVGDFRVLGYKYNERIMAYTGIPYVEAPINLLRFEPPQKKIYVDNEVINDRSKENVQCPQIDVIATPSTIVGEEDCLYLNIYTPITSTSHKLPVMIYIHGGAFAWGTGTIFKPDYLLREDNVILVTINYRLGPLGFLAAGNEGSKIYGNNGLKDQAMAIKWVHDYIAQFGGDTKRITLFGNSAGAASTHLQMFSPASKGLFHSAIIQSGGAFCPWAIKSFKEVSKISAEYARLANCPILPTEEMINCLRQLSLDDILRPITKFLVFELDPMVLFLPTVEPNHKEAFLTDFPENLIKDKNIYDVPIMQGITPDEGAMRTSMFAANPETLYKLDKHFSELYEPVFMNNRYTIKQKKIIRKHYFGDGPLNQDNIGPLTSLWSYAIFQSTEETPKLHYKYTNSSIYSYLFNYKGALTFAKVFGNDETLDLGVCHMDELFYLFPMEFFFKNFDNTPKKLSKSDEKMSLFMTKLWIYFASYKNFDDFEDLNGNKVNWRAVQSSNNEYLIIDPFSEYKMANNFFEKEEHFFRNLEKTHTSNKQIQDEL